MSPPATATQPTQTALVTVEDIHTYYGKSHILHGVSLHVGRGEVVGLIGRNGVGKSTTLKTIMGLVSPSQGKVLFEGRPITGQPSHKLARLGIGFVPEDRRIFKLLTVMENLRTGLDRTGVTDARRQELLDKAFAYFPYAVAKDVDDFHDGEISLRFKLVSGQLDQCAGILFNLKSNGDYLTVRFNGKEDNVVLWTFNKGKRSFVKRGSENVKLAMNEWNVLKIAVQGTSLQASLNGKLLLEYALAEPVSGRIGVWSKTDSVSYFDDFAVTPAAK